jgi:hypothetical protein
VLGGEAAEELGDVFVRVVGADWLLLNRGHLGHGVLADLFVGRPMPSLAFLGLSGKVYYEFAGCDQGRYSRSNLWSSA